MSDYLFPAIPGTNISVSRESKYATSIYGSLSGAEVRVSWQTQPRYRYTVKFNFLRTNVQAPAPYTSYSEAGVVQWFLDVHHGSLDSFLFADPYTGSEVRVRLVDDSVRMTQIVFGIWTVEQFSLESVL